MLIKRNVFDKCTIFIICRNKDNIVIIKTGLLNKIVDFTILTWHINLAEHLQKSRRLITLFNI